MTTLKDYHQFGGRHWETGSVHNVLAYRGVKGPHNGQPPSEAMLLGISGGISFGYFLFHYEGFDPQLALLTRNTFDPLQTLLERLGVIQDVKQTASPEKGQANLIEALENGEPAIVWADSTILPYNGWKQASEAYWAMQPVVVYGHDGEQVFIADRSSQGLKVDAKSFLQARGRVKKDKYRVITLDLPSTDKLAGAVSNSIWQSIRIFTEAPPKGTKRNFGLEGLQHWANMLTNSRNPQSWERFFPPGAGMFAALLGNSYSPGLYGWVQTYGSGPNAERDLYAEFLDEAALVLDKPELKEAATRFRASGKAWADLVRIALPDEIEMLNQGRELLARRHRLFIERGDDALEEILTIGEEFNLLRTRASGQFSLSAEEAAALRQRMSDQVLAIREIEAEAVEAMRGAMS